MYELYQKYVLSLKDTQKYRKLQGINKLQNKNFLDFSTNDYLCLSQNKELLNAGIIAGEKYGVGSTGSRLLSGDSEIFHLLESEIAKKKGSESALFFSSGYLANFSTLSALLDHKVLGIKPIVFFDRSNHASLYQAIFVSNPELVRYNHNNLNNLESLLNKYINDKRPKFIVTETIFGMDGDILPIKEISVLAKQHNAFLYLDEAHATGILGNNGYGLSTTLDLTGIFHLIMGTFSKALGCSGGYVACSNVIKEFLINKASGFIYSTAISPILAGIALKSWELLLNYNKERKNLLQLAQYTRKKINNLGFSTGDSTSHIIPIILETEEKTLKAKDLLMQHQIITSAIRPPTIPMNSSRIRIALNINHNKDDINKLMEILNKLL